MSKYELTFLIEDPKTLKKLEEMITSFSGKKIQEQPWGKRLLAYPINKKTSAEYHTWDIELDSQKLNELKTKLNYENLLLRYLFLSKAHAGTTAKKITVPKIEKEESTDEEVSE